jgi:hypothetical protein
MIRRTSHIAGLLLLALSCSTAAPAAEHPIDLRLARQYFEEASLLCLKDHGRLWGRELCAPVLFADPQTRFFVADTPDPAGTFRQEDGLYIGTLPKGEGIANSAIDWAGRRWTILMWPLPEDDYERARILMHEAFHNIEKDLPLNMRNAVNAHLDTPDGRFWLRMEWRALREALMNRGEYRQAAMIDALLFRAYRRQIFPGAEVEERTGEMHEGLAEYTGDALAAATQRQREIKIASRLERAEKTETFVSTFFYWSGAAYGTLLDASGADWRRKIKADSDFGKLLARAYALKLPSVNATEAETRMRAYDGAQLREEEGRRELGRREKVDNYRRLLVTGPVLEIPLEHIRFTYDPTGLVPLDSVGTVYPIMSVAGDWGNLDVAQGGLMSRDWKRIALAAPLNTDSRPVSGPGWSLELNSGWSLRPGHRRGDLVLEGPEP